MQDRPNYQATESWLAKTAKLVLSLYSRDVMTAKQSKGLPIDLIKGPCPGSNLLGPVSDTAGSFDS